MGIQGLMKLLSEEAPECIKEIDMEELTGRRIAVDASMAMYQFLIAVRSSGPGGAQASMQLTNEAGEVTSHIQGMFNRTIKMMTCGVKPVYVFDGKPPQMKGGELAKRMARRSKAEAELAEAKEAGDQEGVDKFSSRLVKVSKQHNEDCKHLLRLMGVPVVEAPCEAEAQCAELARSGKVYATATEDMDALTFRTPKLLRKMTFAATGKNQKHTVVEIDFQKMLDGLRLTFEEFVDLCILCGCDYCTSIKGIGPKKALKLIREYKSIERIIKVLSKVPQYIIPADWKESKIMLGETSFESSTLDEGLIEEKTTSTEEQSNTSAALNSSEDKHDVAPVSIEAESSEIQDATGTNGDVVSAGADADDAFDVPVPEEEEEEAAAVDDDVELGGISTEDDADEAEAKHDGVEGVDYEIVPPMYVQARRLFTHPDVSASETCELKWAEPDEAGLREYLVKKMGFNETRVESGIARIKAAQQVKAQRRMDSFFAIVAPTADEAAAKKRKAEAAKAAAQQEKKGKMKGSFGKKK